MWVLPFLSVAEQIEFDNLRAKAFIEKKRADKNRRVKSCYVPSSNITANDSVLGTVPYFNEIPFGRPLQCIPSIFKKDVGAFVAYLGDTSELSIKISLRNSETGEIFEKFIPYIHRWTVPYRKSVIAKMYKLEAHLGMDVSDVEVIHLTTYQRGYDPEFCLKQLVDCFGRLMRMLRKMFGTQDYFAIKEPHETGYTHIHMAYFKKLTDAEKKLIQFKWACVLDAGSLDHGLCFSEPRESSTGFYESGSIGSIRGYFMKYMNKGLRSTSMEPHELLFNALLKKNKTRLWTCSRRFSEVMKRPEKELSDWEFESSVLYRDDEPVFVVNNCTGTKIMNDVLSFSHSCCMPPLDHELEKVAFGHIKIIYNEDTHYWDHYHIFHEVVSSH